MRASETRARLIAAALEALRDDGIAGVSSRNIARHGDINQALIFYHFGSVEKLLVAVARTESERRAALYAPALRSVSSFSELVEVAEGLHNEEFAAGNVAALTQMLAGATGSEALSQGIWDALEPWTTLVDETIDRLLAGTAYADLLPREDLTLAITALFLGIELFAGLRPGAADSSVFETLRSIARLLDGLLQAPPPLSGDDG